MFCPFVVLHIILLFILEFILPSSGYFDDTRNNKTVGLTGVKKDNIVNYLHFKQYQIAQKFYTKRRNWATSNLGSYLFKTPNSVHVHKAKKETRLILILDSSEKHFEQYDFSKFLNKCSVKNCVFTKKCSSYHKANAVVVNIYDLRKNDIRVQNRDPNQIWILYNSVSPTHLFRSSYDMIRKISDFVDLFNWTMTYRTDADIPIPYGRTIPLDIPVILDTSSYLDALPQLIPFWSEKSTKYLIAMTTPNCNARRRMKVIDIMKTHISFDVYGNCSDYDVINIQCLDNWDVDCRVLSRYLFYMVVQLEKCDQYLTEKIFYAYSKGAIPVIWGPAFSDCYNLLPPNSFLHADQFHSYKQLARRIKEIGENKRTLYYYHEWRKHYKVVNEYGSYGTPYIELCRICEALNYNNNIPHTYNYEQLRSILDPNETCW